MTDTLPTTTPAWPLAKALANLWTNSVAYVALLASAGLSMAGNVADVLRTRGHAIDGLDVAIAVAMPALVVLAVHMFVSPRWDGLAWPMQTLRWAGCLAIGGMAMFVSWFHLHDLLVARDQPGAATILEPLALDAMAVMATALLLAGRRTVATAATLAELGELQARVLAMDTQVATLSNTLASERRQATRRNGQWPEDWLADQPVHRNERGQWVADDLATPTVANGVVHEAETILRLAGLPTAEDLANRPDRLGRLASGPDKPVAIPEGVAELVERMTNAGATVAELNEAIAETYEVSLRTARRWRGQLAKGGE